MISETATAQPVNDRQTVIAWSLIIAAVAALMVLVRGNVTLADPDTQWHIAAGRLMWETGAMPRVDTMSHTYAGQPWIAKEWLSQLLLFFAWNIGGWAGAQVLTGAGIAFAMGIVALRLLRVASPVMVAILCWPIITSILLVATARPHMMSLGVMAVFTHMLLNASEKDQSPPWLALPILALWANLHAAFTLGFVIAACIGLDALLRAAPERRARLAALWMLFGVGLLAAACVHPYGAQSLLINIDMMRGNESVPLIGEWDPHPIIDPSVYRVALPAVMIALLLPDWRRNAARLLLGTFMLYLALKHQRFTMMLAIVAPMISCGAFFGAIREIMERRNLFRRKDPLTDPKWRVPIAIGCLAALLAIPVLGEKAEPPRMIAPVEALAAVPPELRARPGYNSYNFGGFLVMNRVPTFIDGRTDQLFTDNFMGRMYRYMKADDHAAFLAFIEKYDPRWAIVQTGQKDLDAIAKSPKWRETYADEHARVFVRTGG